MTTVLRQATCVAIGGRAVLIEGAPGSGKSSLALALIDRGAVLVGDDGVALESRGEALWAAPPPNIRGLLEVRNVGLLTLPVTSAAVALVVNLDEGAERLPDGPRTIAILGHALPALALFPAAAVLPLRVEKALVMHGLPIADPSLLPVDAPDRQ